MSSQADVQVPEEAVEAVASRLYERYCEIPAPPRGRWEDESAGGRERWLGQARDDLAAALPSLLAHFKERLLSDEAIEAAVRASDLCYVGKNALDWKVRDALGAAIATAFQHNITTAFQHNTDSQGG